MKTISRNLLLLAMAWAVASCEHHWSRELPARNPKAERIYEKFHEMIIPRVEFTNAPVVDAVNFLAELAREKNWGVNLVFSLGAAGPPPPVGGPAADHKLKEKIVTLWGTSMRFLDAIDNICSQADLFWWIDSRALVIASKEAYERSIAPAARK
ncbi:MAG: hypothetical protein NT105_18555 [Verrucomicrobia bacterium]|nr:hypothetical protein [Verrucomicrobiota bacterium]